MCKPHVAPLFPRLSWGFSYSWHVELGRQRFILRGHSAVVWLLLPRSAFYFCSHFTMGWLGNGHRPLHFCSINQVLEESRLVATTLHCAQLNSGNSIRSPKPFLKGGGDRWALISHTANYFVFSCVY